MNSSYHNSCCGKPLFASANFKSVKKQSSGDKHRYDDNEVMFLVADNPTLYLQLGASNKRALESLIFKITRDPSDLRAHVQRITLLIRLGDESGLYGALLDLFIALGEYGIPIRERMLAQAKPYLTEKHFFLLNTVLERGVRDTDLMTDSNATVLSKGYIGRNNFIIENVSQPQWQQSCNQPSRSNQIDPRQEANDCLMYGQIDEARKILEEAVLEEPWREDLQSDLLEIYWATRDIKGCQTMYERLADEFIPTHHTWLKTVERINDALGGA